MTYSFRPRGVCSQEMRVEVDDQGIIQRLEVLGGCSGNLQGIASLVKGMPAQEAIARLKGIRCGYKDTSCPDQFARGWRRHWRGRAAESVGETADQRSLFLSEKANFPLFNGCDNRQHRRKMV